MSSLDISIVILFLIVTIYVGFIKGRGVKSFKDFAVGSKNYSLPILVSTTAATWFGGGDTMGVASEVYKYGIIFGIFYSSRFIGDLITAKVLGPRFSGHISGITLGDMVAPYYGELGRILISLCALFKTFSFIAMQVSAIGIILQTFLEIPFTYAAWLGMGIVIGYSTFGGIRSVIYTDVLQFIFLSVTIPTIGNFLITNAGGFHSLIHQVPASHLDISNPAIDTKLLVTLFLMSIPALNPLLVHRFFLNKNAKVMSDSLTITAFIELPFIFFVTMIGLAALVLYPAIEPNTAFLNIITNAMPIGLKGLAAVGLIAVVMSSADSAVNLNSVLFINDLYQPIYRLIKKKNPSEKTVLLLSKGINLLSGVAATFIALSFKNILAIAFSFLAIWVPVAVVPLYGILFRVYVSSRTFFLSVLSGLLSLILWEQFFKAAVPVVPGFFIGLLGNAVVFFGRYGFIDRHNHALQHQKGALVPAPEPQKKASTYPNWCSFFKAALAPNQLSWAPTSGFAAFVLCLYIAPNFIWQEASLAIPLLTLLKIVGGLLCAGLLLKPYWPRWCVRFFPVYWHTTLMLTLPFVLLLQALVAGFNATSLTNLTLGLFLLALLVPWQTYLMIFMAGSLGALGLFSVLCFNGCHRFSNDSLFLMSFTFVFSALMAFVFSRPKEHQQRRVYQHMKAKAGAFAHDLATPLATLSLHLHTALALANTQKMRALLTAMDTTVTRLMSLKKSSLATLKDQPDDVLFQHECSLKELLDQAVASYPFTPTQRAALAVHPIDPTLKVHTNPFSFMAMLQNLFKNAFEALENSGRSPEEWRLEITAIANDTQLTLTIQDTGIGMTHDEIEQASYPFYTTKEDGTGLGLATARDVLEKSTYNGASGSLTLTSTPKEGTSVSLVFL